MTPRGVMVVQDRAPPEPTTVTFDGAPPSPELDAALLLARCLAAAAPRSGTLQHLEETLHRAFGAGAHLFEVVVGAPISRYGARLTFSPGPDPRRLASAFDLGGPAPAWVGVRVLPDGRRRAKAYHRPDPAGPPWSLPSGFPAGLQPVMYAGDGDATEHYFRLRTARAWGEFAAACTAPLGGAPFDFSPWPRAYEAAFGVSVRREGDRVTAVSLYADQRCFAGDDAIRAAWPAGMADDDRRAYELALAGVRGAGVRHHGAWHGMLAWTLEENVGWHRAASLRAPRPAPSAPSIARR